tara:strand:+ start:1237 stop:1905 length:669 start_codon:yes stop_codon:yes gene_type:complete
MSKNLDKLQREIKIKFKNIALLKKTLSHKSYDSNNNYEKLEFLGDRVLGLIISKKLLELYPHKEEGFLDKTLASLVNKNKCYEIGKKLSLNKYILLGNVKNKSNFIEKKIVSDCCEALIGAIYLDGGFEVVQKFILNVWSEHLTNSKTLVIDPKTKLQEYSLKKFKSLPVYKLISSLGPKHKPVFKVSVKLKDNMSSISIGNSKKDAQQSAANELIKKIQDI